MGMLIASVDEQLFVHGPSQFIFGQHAFDGVAHDGGGLFGHQFLGDDLFLSAGITGVGEVVLLAHFIAGKSHLVGIDDDYVVATVHMGCEGGFVLATQDGGDGRAHPSHGLVGGVDEMPFVLDVFLAGRLGFIT